MGVAPGPVASRSPHSRALIARADAWTSCLCGVPEARAPSQRVSNQFDPSPPSGVHTPASPG